MCIQNKDYNAFMVSSFIFCYFNDYFYSIMYIYDDKKHSSHNV